MSKDLQKQYEAYPYPCRDPKNDTQIITLINDLALIGHYGFGGQDWYSDKDCRVLIAGGGTGDATLHLAQQLSVANPDAEIIHLDLSQTSNDITQARLDHKGLNNVKVVKGSLLDLPNGELGAFDYINCSGVLHHLKAPDVGAKALCFVLKDHGVMSVMLYGEYGRRIVYDIQSLARMVSTQDEGLVSRIPLVREVLDALPAQNPLRNVFPLEMPDNELVDRYLHSQDRAYTVPQIFEMLEVAALNFISFVPAANYDPLLAVCAGDLHDRIKVLPEMQRMAFAEILRGSMDRHIFFAAKKDHQCPQRPDPKDLDLVPVLITAGMRLRQQNFPNGVMFAQPVEGRLEPEHLRIVSRIDGMVSLNDIFKSCAAVYGMGEDEFETLWLEIYRVLSSRGNLALKKAC